jgi:hypothetical protein
MSAPGRRRLLVLFPDEWDRAVIAERGGGHTFFFEGFDLFRFPDNARLFTYDVLRFADRLVRQYRQRGLDGILTSDEPFGPTLAALVAERLGLPHTPLPAVLTAQHKFYARSAFQAALPGANPRFGLISRDFHRHRELPLPFPFYVKPVKAAFSVLARRVASWEELVRHVDFAWFERAIIQRLVRPFGEVMRARSSMDVDPFSMIAEEVIDGRQVTANGFVRDGEITQLGVVDSVMYPGTDQFQRFQYPSSLPPARQHAVEEVASAALRALGFTHGMFNVEARVCEATGHVKLIEVNPRVAGQFFDLFERVDGTNLFDVLLSLETGEAPVVRRRQGPDAVAASFVMRDIAARGLSRWPGPRELEQLRARHAQARLMVYPKRGANLARERKWLGSYRYAVANMGAASEEALFDAYRRLHADVDFHPAGTMTAV